MSCGGQIACRLFDRSLRLKEETMKFDRLMSGLILGLMFAAGSAFAQSTVQPLNTDGIAKAMG